MDIGHRVRSSQEKRRTQQFHKNKEAKGKYERIVGYPKYEVKNLAQKEYGILVV